MAVRGYPGDGEAVPQPRVQSRLLRVFVLQLALISLITVSGILAASFVAERILVNKALEGEAAYFWKRRADNPDFGLPDTLNLQSWFDDQSNPSAVPENLRELAIGQHRVELSGDTRIVHVSEREGEKLYLLFQDETVSSLAFYFGIVPLTLVLLIMYSLAFLAYWLSRRAISPIVHLADVIERFDFNARDVAEFDLAELPGPKDSETFVLAQALGHFVKRSRDSIERERNFSRYASHELRTPIAVIQGSVASLELLALEGPAARAVARIRRSSTLMGQLITSLLLLARDSVSADAPDSVEDSIDVNEVVAQLIDEITSVEPKDSVVFTQVLSPPMQVKAPPAVVSMVLGNLLRNAWNYTDRGEISVVLDQQRVVIRDTGPGLSEQELKRIFDPFYRSDSSGSRSESVVNTLSGSGLSAAGESATHDTRMVERASSHTGFSEKSGARRLHRPRLFRVQGLGLGLAIVRHFCDIHGWAIDVSSQPGEGSCFTLDFKGRQ